MIKSNKAKQSPCRFTQKLSVQLLQLCSHQPAFGSRCPASRLHLSPPQLSSGCYQPNLSSTSCTTHRFLSAAVRFARTAAVSCSWAAEGAKPKLHQAFFVPNLAAVSSPFASPACSAWGAAAPSSWACSAAAVAADPFFLASCHRFFFFFFFILCFVVKSQLQHFPVAVMQQYWILPAHRHLSFHWTHDL